jgi:hypothetical protein
MFNVAVLPFVSSLLIAGSAHAENVNLTFGAGLGDAVMVTTPLHGSAPTLAGPYQFTISGSSNSDINGTKLGFCIQFNEDIHNGQSGQFMVETLAADLMGRPSLGPVQGQVVADQILYLLKKYGDPMNPTYPTPISDALTVAIWDVLEATGNDPSTEVGGNPATETLHITGGGDSIAGTNNLGVSWAKTSTAVTTANGWLSGLKYGVEPLAADLFDSSKVVAFFNDGIQDQSIVLGISPFGSSTPEPSRSTAMAGMALLGMVIGGGRLIVRRTRRAV